ncbi:MAG: ribosome maturation factor RimP [Alphaproteobacteria bacterium]
MEPTARIEKIIGPSITAMGYGIVRVDLAGDRHRVLQIMVERDDGATMTVDDCSKISRAVSALLDVDDPIAGAYSLEVSSPGIDRPLVKAGDFERFAGFEVRVETLAPIAGRRRFTGRLEGLDGETVRVRLADDTVDIPLTEIGRAKLILTDELLARAATH